MRYEISLTVKYAYDYASDHARSLLHLMPLIIPGQQDVSACLLSVDPPPQERWDGVDFFGNRVNWITFHEPIDSFSLTLKAQISRTSLPPPMDLSSGLNQLSRDVAAVQSVAAHAPHHFLGNSPRISPSPAITAFALDHTAPEMNALQAVLSIGQALHDAMEFDSEATDVHTSPSDAFSKRRGVCQDFTHIMIACLRGLGIPAGYVSGFLRTTPPPGKKRLEGADAMHAWVRAWCGAEMGWIEYDPTNAIVVGDSHIVIAYGRDYSDVSPVRGTLRSTGGHNTQHSVDVVRSDGEE